MAHNDGERHGRGRFPKESSTKHHRAAENTYGSENHKKAAQQAKIAQEHSVPADQPADEEAADELEHHGMKPGEPSEK